MEKETSGKYPNSANLFQFCRKFLDHKYQGVRVIDQDVGQILEFDPADCSHWKKGKKNIKSVAAVNSIASFLGVDVKVVMDVALGSISAEEAFFESTGYSAFQLNLEIFEKAKKEFYRSHSASWSPEKEKEFRQSFRIDSRRIESTVEAIHQKINFEEAPLYLPEVTSQFPHLRLQSETSTHKDFDRVAGEWQGENFHVTFEAGMELRPYVRYRIAKSMAKYFLQEQPAQLPTELGPQCREHLSDVEGNLFASLLLTPTKLLKQEMSKTNPTRDMASQLAETFWVSRSFINRRIQDLVKPQE